jgi:plasmid stabilization system protein ParE
MARIELAPEVMDDLDRFVDHMTSFGVANAIEVLTHSPQIGRPTRGDKRELVIGKGARGYVALYRYLIPIDTVFVLAVRSQRESGYKRRRSRS